MQLCRTRISEEKRRLVIDKSHTVLVLGLSWLALNGPQIDWTKHVITGLSPHIP